MTVTRKKKEDINMVVKTVVEAQDIFDKAWEGFKGVDWKEKASVSRFVQANYTPYDGDESFLAGPTERSLHIKKIVEETKAHYEETRFPMDTRPTSIADIPAGFIDKENEVIFGIQNDELFKLNFMPKGGIRMAETTLKENGYEPDPAVHEIFTKYVTTVNDGIFPCLHFKHSSRTSRTHCNWSSRCILTRTYHRCLRTSCSLRCRLLDARKSKRLECN